MAICSRRSGRASRRPPGMWTVRKSQRGSSSSRSATASMPSSAARSGARNGSKPTTFMSRPTARRATSRPMRPRPTTPSVLPASCVPTNLLRSHLPACMLASAAGMCRARASSRAMVVLGGADGVAAGRVHDDDALARGGGDVDVVHADAGPDDGPQLAGVFEQLGGDLRAAADDDAVGGAQGGLQVVALEAGAVVDFEPGLAGAGRGRRLRACRRSRREACETPVMNHRSHGSRNATELIVMRSE